MDTEERLEKLERELARAKRLVAVLALIAVGLSLSCVLPRTGAKSIHANQFVLEDEHGTPRAGLRMGKDGPGLILLDENGNRRAELCALKGASALTLFDENEKMRVGLTVDKDGSALVLCDENGNHRVGLVVGKDGPAQGLFDEKGKRIWHAP